MSFSFCARVCLCVFARAQHHNNGEKFYDARASVVLFHFTSRESMRERKSEKISSERKKFFS